MERASINSDDELVEYAEVGDLDGIKRTLDIGANVHFRDDAAFRVASRCGQVEAVKLLLEKGAHVHVMRDYALRYASKNGHVNVIKVLLGAGADLHVWDDWPLRWASGKGHVNAVIKLIEAGADLEILKQCWGDMFGCEAPDNLVEMDIKKVVKLMVTEAVGRELV